LCGLVSGVVGVRSLRVYSIGTEFRNKLEDRRSTHKYTGVVDPGPLGYVQSSQNQ
jgi:hypothetical protein